MPGESEYLAGDFSNHFFNSSAFEDYGLIMILVVGNVANYIPLNSWSLAFLISTYNLDNILIILTMSPD